MNTPLNHPVPLSERDVTILDGLQGALRSLPTDTVAERLSALGAARLVVVHDYVDAYGAGGNYEIVGSTHDGAGPWRHLHPDVWRWLEGASAAAPPSEFSSLLDDVCADDVAQMHPIAPGVVAILDDRSVCVDRDCDERIDEDSGLFCGWHSQLVEEHADGAHGPGEGDTIGECPDCE